MAAEAAAVESAPRGFGEREVADKGGLVDVVGGSGWDGKPKAVRPGREEEEKKVVLPKDVSEKLSVVVRGTDEEGG
jgi:hypothetical protein